MHFYSFFQKKTKKAQIFISKRGEERGSVQFSFENWTDTIEWVQFTIQNWTHTIGNVHFTIQNWTDAIGWVQFTLENWTDAIG